MAEFVERQTNGCQEIGFWNVASVMNIRRMFGIRFNQQHDFLLTVWCNDENQ
jgi:hypothetical protein